MVKLTSPINDLFIRLKNAGLAKKREVKVPYSSLKETIAKLLLKEGYLAKVDKKEGELIIELSYKGKDPVIIGVKNISKPGIRIYRKAKDVKVPLGGAGTTIVSTSKGIMSHTEAKKKGLGGEVLAEVW